MFNGKIAISMAIFNSFLYVHQRVHRRTSLDVPMLGPIKDILAIISHQ